MAPPWGPKASAANPGDIPVLGDWRSVSWVSATLFLSLLKWSKLGCKTCVACLKLDFAACHFYLLCVTCSMSLPKSLRRSYASQEKRIEKMYSRLRCLSPPSSLVFCNRNLGMEQNSEPFVNSQPSKWMVSTRISPSNHGIVFSVLTQLLKSMLQAAWHGKIVWHCLQSAFLQSRKIYLQRQGFYLQDRVFSGRSTADQSSMETEKLPPWSPWCRWNSHFELLCFCMFTDSLEQTLPGVLASTASTPWDPC